jgi:hypothetical protein
MLLNYVECIELNQAECGLCVCVCVLSYSFTPFESNTHAFISCCFCCCRLTTSVVYSVVPSKNSFLISHTNSPLPRPLFPIAAILFFAFCWSEPCMSFTLSLSHSLTAALFLPSLLPSFPPFLLPLLASHPRFAILL